MRKRKKMNVRIIRVSFVLFIFILTCFSGYAFGFLGISDTASWKEEVLLHDGSKIVVERWQKHGGRHELGQEPGIKEQSITFTMPGTKKIIKWKDEYSEELGNSNFELFALHILNATPYIITSPSLCLAYNKWGRPNPPYVIFKFDGGIWKRIGLAELPVEFKNINLVINVLKHEEKLVSKGFVSAEVVKELNSSLTQEECKSIGRTPMSGVGCPDWSHTNFKAPIPITPKVKGTESK